MMRRIDLLPPVYVRRRRERRDIALAIVVGLLVLLLLIGWWVLLGFRVTSANNELADVQARNLALQQDIDELQRFVELQNEVDAKRAALQTVMAGDVDWPAIMTEIAMVIPGEVWLETMTASAGTTEGATPVGTETSLVPIASQEPFGRIQFSGNSLTMPGVAKWMIRLESVDEFFAVYLSRAAKGEAEGTGPPVVDFESTLELSDKAASRRFQQLEIP